MLDTLLLDSCIMLQVLPVLPKKLRKLSAINCTALQVPFAKNVFLPQFSALTFQNCPNFLDISIFLNNQRNDISIILQGFYSVPSSFNKDLIIKDLMVKEVMESFVLPGDDFPNWLPYTNEGCKPIRFQVPHQLLNCITLNKCALCLSFSKSNIIKEAPVRSILSVVNNTTNGFKDFDIEKNIEYCAVRRSKAHLFVKRLNESGLEACEDVDEIEVVLGLDCRSMRYSKTGEFIQWPKPKGSED